MKALVISDRQEITHFVNPLLLNKSFDLIHYKSILKALDNIEEIQPDIIILSADEFPRHWKTLVGFVQSGIGGNEVKVYLYDKNPLSDEDNKKALELGVLKFEEAFKERHAVEVEIGLNASDNGQLCFCSGSFYPDEDFVELDKAYSFEDGFIKYVTLYDGSCVTSFSGELYKSADGISGLHVNKYYEKEIQI